MKEFRFKGGGKFLTIINSFSPTEKVIFTFLTVAALFSSLAIASKVNSLFLVAIPSHGGSFSEGMIGLPRSINPILAFTDTDKDLTALIYSGLMKYEGNELVKDIASSYTISEDGLVYDFKIKNNVRFHDGTLLTTDDIEYTIQKIQDGDLKSPRRVDWASIVIKKISTTEIQFILKQPYTPFLSNTTIGILPKHIWKNINADQFIFNQKNLEPIGSGPYKVNAINKDKDGNPTSYTLTSFNKFYNGEPYISKIYINFYQNEDDVISAYKNGSIENFAGISALNISKIASTTNDSIIIHNPLPRIFGIFLNQNNSPVLANKEVRQALNMSVNKDKIVKDVLYNYAVSINSPIPVDSSDIDPKDVFVQNSAEAKSLLAKNGWLINSEGILQKKTGSTNQTLEFTITTADSVDLKKIAELVKKDWENLGAKVNIKVFEFGDLSQNIIKTRKYDALLFGEIISKDLDLYAFWHSSQRNSPGLNVSMYVNSRVDKILEDVRSTIDEKQRDSMRESFKKILKDEVPAVFLYSPEYIYVMSKEIDGYNLKSITNHSDRFYGIEKWFINTDNIWKIFVKNNN